MECGRCRPYLVDVRAVAVDPVIPSRLYGGMSTASSAIRLFRSENGGANWTSFAQFELGGYSWISSVLVDPANPELVYAAANGARSYCTLFKTTNGEANWTGTYLFGMDRVVSTSMMALDASDLKTTYLGDYDDVAGDAILFKSSVPAWDTGKTDVVR